MVFGINFKCNFVKIISLTTSLKRNPKQIFSKVDNEVIMLSLDEGKYYSLNEVGARIWELIDQPLEVKTLVSKLTKEFDVSNEVCANETLRLLNEFNKEGLIILF